MFTSDHHMPPFFMTMTMGHMWWQHSSHTTTPKLSTQVAVNTVWNNSPIPGLLGGCSIVQCPCYTAVFFLIKNNIIHKLINLRIYIFCCFHYQIQWYWYQRTSSWVCPQCLWGGWHWHCWRGHRCHRTCPLPGPLPAAVAPPHGCRPNKADTARLLLQLVHTTIVYDKWW